jgi:hypothetical protein
MILAGDVGGTKVHLALYDFTMASCNTPATSVYPPRTTPASKRSSRSSWARQVTAACFGVPGPVRDGRLRLTNLPWTLDSRELSAGLDIEHVFLINDLEANGYGVAELKARPDLHALRRRRQPDRQPRPHRRRHRPRRRHPHLERPHPRPLSLRRRPHRLRPAQRRRDRPAPLPQAEIQRPRQLRARRRRHGPHQHLRVPARSPRHGRARLAAATADAGRPQRRHHRNGPRRQKRNLREGAGHVRLRLWRRSRQPGPQGALRRRPLRRRRHRPAHPRKAQRRHLHEGLHRQGPPQPVAHQHAGAHHPRKPRRPAGRRRLRRSPRRRTKRRMCGPSSRCRPPAWCSHPPPADWN